MSHLPQKRALLWGLLAALTVCWSAWPQQALVVTSAESAARQPAGVSLQVVDFAAGAALPDVEVMPGPAATSLLLLSQDGRVASICTGSNVPEGGHYASFYAASFCAASTVAFAGGWRPVSACTATGRQGEAIAVAGYQPGEKGAPRGSLYAFAIPGEERAGAYSVAADMALAQMPLAGEPAGMTAVPPGDRIAAIYFGQDNCAVGVVVVDVPRAETVAELDNLADEAEQMSTAPGGLAISRDSRTLFVLVTGYAIGQRSGEAMSWLYALDADTLARRGEPLELPGVAEPGEQPIKAAGANACWVATRPRGSDFAYATLVRPTEAGLSAAVQLPFSGVSESFFIAADPDGAGAAVALDDCVQIRDERGAVVADWSFKSPVRLVCWTRDGLLAGEAGRIHLLNASAPDVVATIQLQTGHVTDAALLPDGAWASAGQFKAGRLVLPQSVVFRGEAVGQEVKALPIQPPPISGGWSIDYDRTAMPWLVIHPTTGIGPGVVYMGVDPAWYRPGSIEEGLLRVQVAPSPRDVPEHGRETAVEVRLLPEESTDVQRVLWVWGDGEEGLFRDEIDPRRLRALAEILAGPPHYLAHKEVAGNVQEPLDAYEVVVLSAEAAAGGLIARRAVLDYIQNGGAVLFLGRHLAEGGERELSQWLAPAGIQVNADVLVEGTFPVAGGHWLTRHWPQVQIRGGCGIYTDDAGAIRVPGAPAEAANSCVFMTRTYGRGRIAVLASQSVLESAVIDTQEGLLFAGDLFRWLAGADKYLENQDMDSDGLPDDLEDTNGNGITERNETNFLERDSDQDGLPDGMEDANLNGLPDEGETDPLNSDSDGDGVQDGADDSAAPPAGAPALHAINPAQGPAEGGTTVVISGRDLPADAAVWFGDRPSPSVRVVDTTELVAETPAFRESRGGQAPVRIQSRSGDVQGALARGFLYTPRSTIRIALESVGQAQIEGSTYEGKFVVRLGKQPEAVLENVTLVLAPDPPNSVEWPSELAARPQRGQPLIRLLQSGELLMAVLNADSLAGAAQLATISWRAESVADKLPAIRIKHALVYARNGQILQARTSDLALQQK